MSNKKFDNNEEIIQETEENLDALEEQNNSQNNSSEKEIPKKEKKKITVSLRTFVISSVAIALAAVMLTYTVFSEFQKKNYGGEFEKGYLAGVASEKNDFSTKELIDQKLSQFFFNNKITFDPETQGSLTTQSLKQYVASLGDPYAQYYTFDEYIKEIDSKKGISGGIGITVIKDQITVDGKTYLCAYISDVAYGSPAETAKIQKGDYLVYIGSGENKKTFDELGGYDKALDAMLVELGEELNFVTLHPNADGTFTENEYKIKTEKIVVSTVTYYVSTLSVEKGKVGVIQIKGFDYPTPAQFKRAVEALKKEGCDKFVIDLRDNPGGSLVSIRAVLSFFLTQDKDGNGDVYIRTKDKNGEESERIKPYNQGEVPEGCEVSKKEIGMYKDLNMVVLCNEGTASAAELFVATFRDYNLGKIVGTKTFGKGSMQSIFFLGDGGAIKFTTKIYFSAKSGSYDGIGIYPDVKSELSEEALKYEYRLTDEKDDQLVEAIKHFK